MPRILQPISLLLNPDGVVYYCLATSRKLVLQNAEILSSDLTPFSKESHYMATKKKKKASVKKAGKRTRTGPPKKKAAKKK